MTDERDPLQEVRWLRPDRPDTAEPNDPWVLAQERERLMSLIDETTEPGTGTHYPAIYPRLGYLDEVAALDYLTRVFGFRERREARMGTGAPEDSMLAWLEHGDGVIMIGRTNHDVHKIYSPREVGHATAMINVHVDDIDAHYQRAVHEGAIVTMEINDAFYGFRRYEAEDPEGNRWHFNEPLDSVRRRRGDG